MISFMVIGSLLGLMWAAALRGWMVLLALGFGEQPQLTWEGTFLGILLPAALVGALLGGAEHARITRGSKGWRWAILAPLLLAIAPAIVTENFFTILLTTGMGGGAIGVALIGLLGGYAVAGRGPWWTRVVSGSLGSVLLLGIAGLFFGDPQSPLSAAGKAFGGTYGLLLMVLLIAGSSIPHRRQVDP